MEVLINSLLSLGLNNVQIVMAIAFGTIAVAWLCLSTLYILFLGR